MYLSRWEIYSLLNDSVEDSTCASEVFLITEDERTVICDGLLSLIQSINSAKALVRDSKALGALDELNKKYLALLNKLTNEV